MLSSGDQKNSKNQGGPPISLSDAKNRIAADKYGEKKLRKGRKSRETNRMHASLRGGVRKLRTSKKRRRTKKARRSRRTKRR